MRLLTRSNKNLLFLVAFVTVPFWFWSYFRPSQPLHDFKVLLRDIYQYNNKLNLTKMGEAESLDKLNTNKKACVLPKLNVNDPNIMKFYKAYPKFDCGSELEWLVLGNGTFIVNEEAKKKFSPMSCDAFPLIRKSDYINDFGTVIKDVKTGQAIDHDIYKVNCKGKDNAKYENIIAGVRRDPAITKRPTPDKSAGLGLDVLIFAQDSTSRMAMHRHQPKTVDYLINTLRAIEMEGHAILGDGTPPAVMGMLLGYREEELHEARRGYPGVKPVDDFPWVWNEFKDHGYVTMWHEQTPGIGTFHYRMMGFTNPPVDHYLRPFGIAQQPYLRKETLCMKSRSQYDVLLGFVRDMWTTYPKSRGKFAFLFMDNPCHGDNNKLAYFDETLRDYFARLHIEGHLNNTLLIVMGDHGSRNGKVRAFDQGKMEERLPAFSFRFPPWFHKKYPEIIANINHNSKMLTTPFDIHETFREILKFTGSGPADISKRGVSLFKRIPESRTCKSAQVDDHWCTCLDWKAVSTDSEVVKQATREIIGLFNNKTATHRRLCRELSLHHVMAASSHQVNSAVLRFKDTNDGGRGRFGKMTDTTEVTLVTYQISLQTTPGGGQFEVTISQKQKTGAWFLDPKSVSRINKYGDAPKCIAAEAPDLREYCVCSV